MTEALSPTELAEVLTGLPEWSVQDGALTRTRQHAAFLDGIDWVRAVAAVAEQLDHHPDIDIRWRTVTLRTCTHDAGDVITSRDIELARQIDALG